jgi:hypothetical protein
MVRKNPNKSFYHFKVNHLDDAGVVIESNRYFTLKDMVQRYQTTEYLIRQNIKCKISNVLLYLANTYILTPHIDCFDKSASEF